MKRTVILSACLLVGCGAMFKMMGLPPNPTRESPPPGISEKALAVGSHAPELSLPALSGSTWSLQGALAKGPVVLVFYRGHW